MTTGYSGSFAVNGTRFLLQPTTAGWVDRDEIGIDGNGHPIYASNRQFIMKWGLAHPNDVKQLIDIYKILGSTGTAVFDLPEWGESDYIFESYTGCTMQEPKVGEYFNGYITDVSLFLIKVNA